jgi:acyl carrier protein
MNEIERWLVEHFDANGGLPPGETGADLLEVNYFERQLLDSLGIVQMIVGLEEDFGVRLEPEQMQDPRFCTIRGLGQIVAEAQARAA